MNQQQQAAAIVAARVAREHAERQRVLAAEAEQRSRRLAPFRDAGRQAGHFDKRSGTRDHRSSFSPYAKGVGVSSEEELRAYFSAYDAAAQPDGFVIKAVEKYWPTNWASGIGGIVLGVVALVVVINVAFSSAIDDAGGWLETTINGSALALALVLIGAWTVQCRRHGAFKRGT